MNLTQRKIVEMTNTYYKITVEFMPDLASDPDAFREHRETSHKVMAESEVRKLVQAFEDSIDDLAQKQGIDPRG